MVSVLLGGCILLPIPHDEWLSPRFSGRIVDDTTGQGIAGATVTLTGYHGYAEQGPVVVRTDANGAYVALATRHTLWLPVWLGPAEGLQSGVLNVAREGYVTVVVRDSRFGGAGARFAIQKDVRLVRETRAAPR